MPNLKHSLADFLQGAKTLIENAATVSEISSALALYGYDGARLEEGRKLWSETDALVKKQSLDLGGRFEATQEFDKAWTSANAAYMKALKVARVAFGDDAKAIAALKLYGPRKQTLAGWIEQAETFYANLAADSGLSGRLTRYGYDQAKLKAEAAAVESVRQRTQAKVQGSGTAQASTAARDKKLRELDAWVSELRTIARVAFYENPQELEKLGVIALNTRRPAKKAEAQAKAATVSASAKN
jgi:hypothetical protein